MKKDGKAETPKEHEARMKKWGEEHAAGKTKSDEELRAIPGELSCGKQVWLAAKFPKRFACWVRTAKWRN